ncbi:MAG: nucleotidyltransferase [Desulfuromonadales bacterium]
MRAVGLVTEYNPFHNGHLHHLRQSLRMTGADASVAVMSGHFLQRGEPALVDKWVRTEMALAAGVDLVFELPFAFACNSAPHFAMGAVQSLNALGVLDSLCFGSEAGDLTQLDKVASVLAERQDELARLTAARLRDGVSYPVARSSVVAGFLPETPPDILASPNNILGIEYLKALRSSGSRLVPYTIKRLGAGYHDTDVTSQVASATGIRQMIAADKGVDFWLPEACRKTLNEALQAGRHLDAGRLFIALQSHLLQESEVLRDVYLVDDGIDRRISLAALQAGSFADLVAEVKSRQWTQTRIQRILMYLLLQVKATEMQAFLQVGPLYLRLLGSSERGRKILARARRRKSLPIIADPARATNTLRKFYRHRSTFQQLAEEMLRLDLRATRIYALLQQQPSGDYLNQDYYQPVRQL